MTDPPFAALRRFAARIAAMTPKPAQPTRELPRLPRFPPKQPLIINITILEKPDDHEDD